jgi:CRP-like cAMP-binding protein
VRRRTDGKGNPALYYPMGRVMTAMKKITGQSERRPIGRANLLLAGLPALDRRRLTSGCEEIELEFGDVLCAQGAGVRHVYFPTGGFISLLVDSPHGPALEVGLVGTEGAVGLTLALGVNVAPVRAFVQGSGSALRMETARFSRELARSAALRRTVNRYLYVLMSQLAQMTPCTRFHLVEARLARWLLMTRDRANSDEFHLTQEFIASMLGVRRAGVTRAASLLQKRGLVRYSRGRMIILDGRRLEGLSCPCYAIANDTYARFMGQPAPLESTGRLGSRRSVSFFTTS